MTTFKAQHIPFARVIRYREIYGATEDNEAETLVYPANSEWLTRAFARNTSTRHVTAGPSSVTATDRNNDDLGSTPKLSLVASEGADTSTSVRETTGVNEDVLTDVEVLEHIGPTDGPNAFVLRAQTTLTDANDAEGYSLDPAELTRDIVLTGVVNIADCVPFLCGVRHDGTGLTWDQAAVKLECLNNGSDDVIRMTREDSTGTVVVVARVIEFTGDNYSVQKFSITHAGGTETQAITDVTSWAQAFAVITTSTTDPNDESTGAMVFPGATTTAAKVHMDAGATGKSVVYIVDNPDIKVWHDDTIDGTLTTIASGSAGETFAIGGTVVDMRHASVFACSASADASANYPRPFFTYNLEDRENVECLRGRTGGAAEFALAVVDWTGGEQLNAKPDTVFYSRSLDGSIADLIVDLSQNLTNLTDQTTYGEETSSARCNITSNRTLEAVLEHSTGEDAVIMWHGEEVGGGNPFIVATYEDDYGASADTSNVAVTAVTSIGAGGLAFARNTSTLFITAGPTAGTTTARDADDMTSECWLTSTTNARLERSTGGENVDYRSQFETLEFPSAGNNAAIVRLDTQVSMGAATSQVDTAIASVTNLTDCVAYVCGMRANVASSVADRWSVTAKIADFGGGDVVRLDRGDGASAAEFRIVVVEYTGSNWTVEQKDISHTSVGDQSTTITDISDWTTAFIVGSHRTNSGALDRATWAIRPGASTTSVRTYVADAASTNDFTVYIVSNSELDVEHLDSITSGGTDHPATGTPQTVNTTVSAVADLGTTSVIASSSSGSGSTELSHACWLYQMTTTTNLQWWRSNSAHQTQWAAQIIEWPPAAVNDETYKFGIQDTDTFYLSEGGANVATLALPGTITTNERIHICAITYPNPETTGASDALITELFAYNENDDAYAATWAAHTLQTGADTREFQVMAEAGLNGYTGDVHELRVGEAPHTGREWAGDWYRNDTVPIFDGATRLEPPVPTQASGFGDDGELVGGQYSLTAKGVNEADLRLVSPLVNLQFNNPPTQEWPGLPDPFNRDQGDPEGGSYEVYAQYMPSAKVPDQVNFARVRVHVQLWATSGGPDKISVKCFSMKRLPIIGGLANPLNPPTPIDARSVEENTTTDHTSGGIGEWLGTARTFDSLLPIQRNNDGESFFALGIEINDGSPSATTRYKLKSWIVEPERHDNDDGGLPGGLVYGG